MGGDAGGSSEGSHAAVSRGVHDTSNSADSEDGSSSVVLVIFTAFAVVVVLWCALMVCGPRVAPKKRERARSRKEQERRNSSHDNSRSSSRKGSDADADAADDGDTRALADMPAAAAAVQSPLGGDYGEVGERATPATPPCPPGGTPATASCPPGDTPATQPLQSLAPRQPPAPSPAPAVPTEPTLDVVRGTSAELTDVTVTASAPSAGRGAREQRS